MSDGAISQDEIDALLAGVDMGGGGGSSASSAPASILSANETSALSSFYTELTASLKDNLAQLTGTDVSFSLSGIQTANREEMLQKLPEMTVALTADFNAGLPGAHFFLTSPECASKIASCANNEENIELDEMSLSVIGECFSQISGSEITALAEHPEFSDLAANPVQPVHCPKAMVQFPAGNFVFLDYSVSIGGENYTVWELLAESVARGIAKGLGGSPDDITNADVLQSMNSTMGQMQMNNAPQMNMNGMNPQMMGGMMPQMQMPMNGMNPQMMGGMMPQMPMNGMGSPVMGNMNPANVQTVQFPNLAMQQNIGDQSNINLIMDVYMEMTVELGRTKMLIKKILGMGEGSIIELDKLAGEPVDILVNNKAIAKGEVVVIDENFGVRVTEILSPIERLSDVN